MNKVLHIILLIIIFVFSSSMDIYQDGLSQQQNNLGTQQTQKIYQSNIKSISMRLTPNQDIMAQITKLLSDSRHKNKYTALSIVSAVGSVNYCWIRMANQSTLTKIKGPMEIVSLSGTFDLNLSPHVHISLSRGTGETLGGHLPSLQQRQQALKYNIQQQKNKALQQDKEEVLYDCQLFTTLQLVLLSHENIIYQRKIDPVTTFHELTIRKKYFYQK